MANNEIFDLNTRKGRKAYKKAQQAVQANPVVQWEQYLTDRGYPGEPTLHESAEEMADAVQSITAPVKSALRSALDTTVGLSEKSRKALEDLEVFTHSDLAQGYTVGVHPDTEQVTTGVGAEEPSGDPGTGNYTVEVGGQEFSEAQWGAMQGYTGNGTPPGLAGLGELDEQGPTPSNYYVLSNGIEAKDVAAELGYNAGTAFTYMFRSCRIDGVIKGDPESDLNKAIDHLLFELDRRNFTRKGASA